MSDLISRQQAIDALSKRWAKTKNYDGVGEDIGLECKDVLEAIPFAQPEEVSDQWTRIEYPVGINTIITYLKHERCGLMGRESGMMYLNHEHGWIPYLYCPNCGMRMKGVKDEQLHNG